MVKVTTTEYLITMVFLEQDFLFPSEVVDIRSQIYDENIFLNITNFKRIFLNL